LQGASLGASAGVLTGNPIVGIIGAAGGALFGLYQTVNDTSIEFEKLQKKINENVDVNTKLINGTQQYAQLQSQLVDAINSGASDRNINNLLRQTQDALRQINDLDVRRE